jgi:hypothetical protein
VFDSSGNNTAGGVWTFATGIDATTCESATTNGYYFSGAVKGFQFYVKGITITGVSGGTLEQYFGTGNGYADIYPTTGKMIGTSFGSATIPAGTDVLLTTITFSNAGDDICFVESGCVDDYDSDPDTPKTIEYDWDSCSSGTITQNIMSDINSNEVNTDWGGCHICVDDGCDGSFAVG